MRAVLQRVRSAAVVVDGAPIGAISQGLVILAAIGEGDQTDTAEQMAVKIAQLRIFNDEAGKFNRSLLDVKGGALVVSQFTLYADIRRGRRPSFVAAASPDHAEALLMHFTAALRALEVAPVETGRFGAAMLVELQNDGPVTIWLDSDDLPTRRG